MIYSGPIPGRAPWREDVPRQPRRPPESFELDSEPHWNVEKILKHEHRIVGSSVRTCYTVRWEGMPQEEGTEEPAENLKCCTEAYANAMQARGGNLDPPADLLDRCAARTSRRSGLRASTGPAPCVSCDVRGCCSAGPAASRCSALFLPPDSAHEASLGLIA